MTERVHSGAPLAAGATVPGGEIYCDFSRGIVDRYKELAITLDRPAAAASSLTLSLESSHFLEPNEYTASRVVPHFKETDGGVHICTGSERFFFKCLLLP